MKALESLAGQVDTLQRTSGKKHVIYTCVTNGYSEVLPAPESLRELFDFIIFSDKPCQIDGWTQLTFEPFHADPRRSAKVCKILAHKLLCAYESSIWVDGNFELRPALRDLLNAFLHGDEVLTLFRHRRRNCIYEEARECLRWGKDAPNKINDQISAYRSLGHPEGWGLFMGGFLMRKHNSFACAKVMEDWWKEVEFNSVRDQLSLPVVLRRNETSISAYPYEMVSTYFEVWPHLKYRSYTLNGGHLIHPRALIASLVYFIASNLNRFRRKSRRE